MDLATVQASDFEPLLGQTFRADLGGQSFELTLAEAQTSRHQRREPGVRPSFSLLFHGPVDVSFTQGVFPLTHESLGTLEIFLVPVAREDDGRVALQAVFS